MCGRAGARAMVLGKRAGAARWVGEKGVGACACATLVHMTNAVNRSCAVGAVDAAVGTGAEDVGIALPTAELTPAARAVELLAPARDREAFLAALAAGADAIYCGIAGGLNARRKAGGIVCEELPELCAAAHARGVRVYVTMNIVVKQAELAGAVEAAARCLAAGADALIIQDLGLLAEVHRALPEAELHVSTQANVHDARGVALCAELGASRVTLSRELPLTEIASIAAAERARVGAGAAGAAGADTCAAADAAAGRARLAINTPVELEVFAHGAICPSYSGLCMLSSFLREGRSPNRGLCAQPCRLPFDLVDEKGVRLQSPERERPLCTHDNCAIADASSLVGVGVASLKLEGRMKPAAYVHAVVTAWRRELDELGFGRGGRVADMPAATAAPAASSDPAAPASGSDSDASAESPLPAAPMPDVMRTLRRSFNRGLTDAYLRGTAGNELMSYERSGNRGELVGEVVGFEPEPGFVPRDGQRMRGDALVRLCAPVGEGDAVELRHPAEPTRFIVVEAPRAARAGEVVRLRVPRPMPTGAEARVTKSAELERAAREAVAAEGRRLAHAVRPQENPKTRGSFVAFSAETSSTSSWETSSTSSCHPPHGSSPAGGSCRPDAATIPELCALVSRPEDAEVLRAAGAQRVYLDVCGIDPTPAACAAARAAARAGHLVPVLGEVSRESDHARIDPWVEPGRTVAVANLSELSLARSRGALPEVLGCVPIHNTATLGLLAKLGVRTAWLSPELSLAEIRELVAHVGAHARTLAAPAVELAPTSAAPVPAAPTSPRRAPTPDLGLVVFGRPRLMTCEHCVLQVAYDCDRAHASCAHRARPHWLVNIDGRSLPVQTDAAGRSRVYLDEPLDLRPRAHELAASGVARFMVDARHVPLDEAAQVTRDLARTFANGIHAEKYPQALHAEKDVQLAHAEKDSQATDVARHARDGLLDGGVL